MRIPVVSTFPIELIWHIVYYIDDRDDLLSLALIQRRFYEIIIPHFLDYHTIKCPYDKEIVWSHLAEQPGSCKAIKIVSLLRDDSKIVFIPRADSDFENKKYFIPRACKVPGLYHKARYDFYEVLPHFSNLQSFSMYNQSGPKLQSVLKTLTDLNPPLTTLVLHHNSDSYDLLLKDLKPSNLSQLTRLEIMSKRVVDNDVSLMHIILHAEKLIKLVLNVPFDMTDVLKTYTWKHLQHLFLGKRVQFFPETDTDMDTDTNESRLVMTLFFRRHPFLEWLSLPLALVDYFPSQEDVFPHLKALEWQRTTAVPAHFLGNPTSILPSVSQRLDHYSSMFGEDWLPNFRNMSNLQSCCLRLNMDQVRHLEPLFQCAPQLSKLRIELVGSGVTLFGWIKRTIDIILKTNLRLTHLLSLFDDVDMGYQLGKENVERVGKGIPTLEYTTGCVHGKTVFLKINRRYDAYVDFAVLYDPEAVNDPYLTNWGKF